MNHACVDVIDAKNRFRHSVSVLVGGTAVGHLITALALPIATRLYSPDNFSVLAVFVSIISIVSVAASLRFDTAIPIAESDEDAAIILFLALVFAFFISLITVIAVVVFTDHVFKNNRGAILFLLPIAIFLMAGCSGFQGWFVRKSEFKLIARSRFYQSIFGVVSQLVLGVAGVAPLGLLLGYVLNAIAGFITLGLQIFKKDIALFRGISFKSLRITFWAYRRYPKYSTLEALFNSASTQLPVIIIASLAMGPEAGYLTLAMYVMQAPMLIIGNAVGQVYLSGAPLEYRKGTLDNYTLDTLGKLSKIGVGPLIFAAIVAPEGFAIVFGEEWRRAGEMVSWMTPWFVAQFLSSPLSMVIHVVSRQRAGMLLQIYALLVRVLPVWCVSLWDNTFIVEVYALSGLLFYASYLVVVIIIIRASFGRVVRKLYQSLWVILLWISAGLITLTTMHAIRSFFNV